MFEYIKNKELRDLFLGDYLPTKSQVIRKLMLDLDEETIFKLITEDGSKICYLDDKYKENKKLALESVTYRNFFVRNIDNDDPDKPNFDYEMINEVSNAYDSLSNLLKNDIEIIKRAHKSYEEIIEYLKSNPNPSVTFNDGVVMYVDSDYMIDVINDQYIIRYEDLINDYEIELEDKKI